MMAASRPLKIDGEIVGRVAQIADESSEISGQFDQTLFSSEVLPVFSGPDQDTVERGVSMEQVLGGVLDQPCDFGVGNGAAEVGERRQGVGDIPQGSELDDEDVQEWRGR